MELFYGRGLRFSTAIVNSKALKFSPSSSGLFYRNHNRCYASRLLVERYPKQIARSSNYILNSYKNNFRESIYETPTWRHDVAFYSNSSEQPSKDCQNPPSTKKLTLFQKMKQMAKDYWHILVPVHVVTSIGWISIFYIAAKNGVDIASVMEYLNLSERYLEMLRGSSAGHWAIAYALYKIFTPLRYTVTIGGTTMSIRFLSRLGYLKPKNTSSEKGVPLNSKCAEQLKAKFGKTGQLKAEQQPDPPKT